jgi:hypothetical protein
MERIDPAEPMERIDPAEPMERIDPAEPMERADPAEPMERIDPAEPIEPIEPSDRTERRPLIGASRERGTSQGHCRAGSLISPDVAGKLEEQRWLTLGRGGLGARAGT